MTAPNYTDLVPPAGAPLSGGVGQYVPELASGEFVRAFAAGMSAADQAFANSLGWYERIVFDDGNLRPKILELIELANDTRDHLRKVQTWIALYNRMLHGLLGSESDSELAIGQVPLVAARDYEPVGVSNAGETCIVTLRWNGDAANDPRNIVTYSVVENPDWPAPGQDRYINKYTGFGLPAFGLVTFTHPSAMRWHAGLVCYAVVCPEDLASGGTFELHCFGNMGGLWANKLPATETGTIAARYQFYQYHCAEPWSLLRDCYPLMAVQTTVTLNAPAAQEYQLASARAALGVGLLRAWLVTASEERIEFYPEVVMRVEHTGGGNYKTMVNLSGLALTGIARVDFELWLESADGSALNVAQNRCQHSKELWGANWGETGGRCRHTCAKRATASGAANFRAGDDISGGCYQPGTCDAFEVDPGPTNPVAAFWDQVWSHPFLYRQLMEGVAQFELSRIGRPSLASECGLMLQLKPGDHPSKRYWFNARGLCRAQVAGNVMWTEHGFTNWEHGGTPDLRHPEDWPPAGPGAALFAKGAEYPGAEDHHELIARQVTASDQALHPYRLESGGRRFLGQYQRYRAYTALFEQMPATDVPLRAYLDGLMRRGSWEIGEVTYAIRLELKPIRFARQQGWMRWGGHAAEIEAAELLGDNRIALYLRHGEQSATTFFGPPAEISTNWRQGGMHVALPEFLQVRNYASDCTVGLDRDLLHAGQTAAIVGEAALPVMWISDAQACYDGEGARTGSWKLDASDARGESQYYDEVVAIHGTYARGDTEADGALPAGHKAWGARCDRVVIDDEHGAWEAAAGGNAAWFAGKTLSAGNEGVFLGELEITLRDARGPEDEPLQALQYGAQGWVYLTDVEPGNTIGLAGTFADRMGHVMRADLEALAQTLSNATG